MMNVEQTSICSWFESESGTLFMSLLNLVFSTLETYAVIIVLAYLFPDKNIETWSILFCFGFIWIVVTIVLVTGIKKRLPRYIRHWINFQKFMMIINNIGYIGGSLILIRDNSIIECVLLTFFSLIVNAIAVCTLIVVNKIKNKILDENRQREVVDLKN